MVVVVVVVVALGRSSIPGVVIFISEKETKKRERK